MRAPTSVFEGDQAEDVFNGVVVTFTDPVGRRRVVGPPGVYADRTDASLVDTDPLNPVNLNGIPRRYAVLQLSVVTDEAGAIRIGSIFLAEQKTAKRARRASPVFGQPGAAGPLGTVPGVEDPRRRLPDCRGSDRLAVAADHPDAATRTRIGRCSSRLTRPGRSSTRSSNGFRPLSLASWHSPREGGSAHG